MCVLLSTNTKCQISFFSPLIVTANPVPALSFSITCSSLHETHFYVGQHTAWNLSESAACRDWMIPETLNFMTLTRKLHLCRPLASRLILDPLNEAECWYWSATLEQCIPACSAVWQGWREGFTFRGGFTAIFPPMQSVKGKSSSLGSEVAPMALLGFGCFRWCWLPGDQVLGDWWGSFYPFPANG